MVAVAEARQHLVPNSAGGCRKLIHADLAAKQRNEVTPPDGMVGQGGDIDRQKIHRNASGNRTTRAANDGVGTRRSVGRARCARLTVGIADGDHSDARCVLGSPGRVVTDGLPLKHRAHLHDPRL